MNINSVSSAKTANFGLITNKAYQKIMDMDGERFDKDNVKYPMKIQANKDFILHYNYLNDRFALYSVAHQSTFDTQNHNNMSKIDFLKFIIEKMTAMKNNFSTVPLRDKKLDVIAVNNY